MISIHIAQAQDIETIAEFNQAMAAETEQKHLESRTLRAGVQAVFDNPGRGFYITASAESGLVGSLLITYEWSDWHCGNYWWIQSVYILPAWRRQGVFKAMYDFVKTQAAAAGNVRSLRLYVESGNTAARQCYQQLAMSPSTYVMYEQAIGRNTP